MNSEEYDNLAKVEKKHWYYSGKREIVRYWIEQSGAFTEKSVLADCGSGTGAFAVEMLKDCRIVAIDDYPESLGILRQRLGENLVRQGSCTALPLETESCDYVTALDVLEHVDDHEKAMEELFRITKKGGTVIITVPAMMSLWSDWDVALRHFRRYDRKELQRLISRHSCKIVQLNYMNFWAFPVVWLLRGLRTLLGQKTSRAEDRIPPGALNRVLQKIFVWSSCQTRVRWPFGVGLLAVLRKNDN